MSRIVLIHGFATGIGYSVFRPALGVDAGFTAFRDDIESGDAKAFRWDIKGEATLLQSLNPFYTWDIYRRELAIAKDAKTHRRLAEFLSQERPEMIICHSMGGFLLSRFLKRGNLPTSVRWIVLNQADVPRAEFSFRSDRARVINTYCFWDPTLWCSAIIRRSLSVGLVGTRNATVRNRFFPLFRPINFHTSAIRSRRFRDFCFFKTAE